MGNAAMMGQVETAATLASETVRELEAALSRIGVTRAHKIILVLILAGALFDSFEQNTVGIVGPALKAQWELSAADIGFLNTITFIFSALGRLVAGFVADRYGRRLMLNVDLLLFTLGAVICATAPSFAVLCVGRAVVGSGLGGELSIAITMLAEFCPARFRGTAVGLVNVGSGGFGNFLAPGFGLLVFMVFPGPEQWRWLFAVLVAPALLVVVYRRFIPETPRYLLSRGDIEGANLVLSRLASGRLTQRPPPVSYISAAAATIELVRSRPTGIFKQPFARRTVPASLAIWMTYGSQLSVLTLMPTILVAQGYTVTRSLLFTMMIQAGSFLGALVASIFGYHLPRKWVLTGGSLFALLAGLAFGYLARSAALIVAFGATFQFFVLLLNTTMWIYVPELFPTRMRGFGTGFILAIGITAGAVMPVIAGRLVDGFGVAAIFAMIAIMYAIFAGCIQLLPETYGRSMEDIRLPAEPMETSAAS
jgi:putative MFS transporter